MLTRDLLRYRVHRGHVIPRFIDLADDSLLHFATALLATVTAAVASGMPRGTLTESLADPPSAAVHGIVARGFHKLVLDRCDFADSTHDYAARREALFKRSSELLRQCPPGSSLAQFVATLRAALDPPDDLYGDLPDNRPLVSFRPLSPAQLLQRYNMAQVQGLIVACRTLRVETTSRDVLAVRRLLRWLKFCRLVAEITHLDGAWTLQITGPAALFDHAKKYGLQLATFLPAIPLLGQFSLIADVALRPNTVWQLALSAADPLVSPHAQQLGHIPPEISQVAAAFDDADGPQSWQLDPLVEPRHVGANGVMLPDLTFRHAGGQCVHVELFHRWHRQVLTQRIEQLVSRSDAAVLLGIERSVRQHPDVRALLDRHPQVNSFAFSTFPTHRGLRTALSQFAPAAGP